MALHTKPSVHCLTPKSMSGTAFWQETSVEKRLPDQKSHKHRNLPVGVRFTESAYFWPLNCFKLPARKQAFGHCFCRIRENLGRTKDETHRFATCRAQIRSDFGAFWCEPVLCSRPKASGGCKSPDYQRRNTRKLVSDIPRSPRNGPNSTPSEFTEPRRCPLCRSFEAVGGGFGEELDGRRLHHYSIRPSHQD